MAAFKRFDGQALGSEKIGECSGESEEKILDIPVPPQTTPIDKYAPKLNHLRNKLDGFSIVLSFVGQNGWIGSGVKLVSQVVRLGSKFVCGGSLWWH